MHIPTTFAEWREFAEIVGAALLEAAHDAVRNLYR